MALSYLTFPNSTPRQDQISEWGEAPPGEEIQTHHMDTPLKMAGFELVFERRLPKHVIQLKEYNVEGFLTIILIYDDLEGVDENRKQHYIVVTGYDENGIYAHDPSRGNSTYRGYTGPNIYITNDVLLQLWKGNRPFWGLVIPYVPEKESRYAVTVTIKGLTSEIATNISVDGKFKDRKEGDGSSIFEFTVGTDHTISVDPYINGSWTPKEGAEYFCTNNSWTFYSWNKSLQYLFTYESITHYYLEVLSEYGDSQGSGWYLENSSVNISVNLPVKMKIEEGVRDLIVSYEIYRIFDKWTGDVNANTTKYRVIMDGPKSIIAVWRVEENQNINFKIPLIIFNVVVIISVFSYAVKSSLTPRESSKTSDTKSEKLPPKNRE